jgi:hypothetical protein
MQELDPDTIKAIASVAKTGLPVLDRVGNWVGKVLGPLPADLLGLAGADYIHHKRLRNLADIEAKTEEKLADIAAGRRNEPSPSLLIPLLRDAADESREVLQDLWAALLARSLVDDGTAVRRAYFEIVKALEPADAMVFKVLMGEMFKIPNTPLNPSQAPNRQMQIEDIWRRLRAELGEDELQVSLEALKEAGLLVTTDMANQRPSRLGSCFFKAACSDLT